MTRLALGLHWDLQPDLAFLNHGSFGLAPRELLAWRSALLQEIEQDPVGFVLDAYPTRLAEARAVLADLLHTQPAQLAFVPSTTYGLNELFQSLQGCLPQGSEILLSNHGYNATTNLVAHAAAQRGWTLRRVALPLPVDDPQQVVDAFQRACTPATRLLLVDHITSPTALVLPVAELVQLARDRGAWIVVDGAHGPGSVSLNLDSLQPDAYVGNLHKWLCCPRGSAFLWAQGQVLQQLRPLVISHGANAPPDPAVSRFHQEHDWIGTADPSPWLALPEALRLLTRAAAPEAGAAAALEGLMRANHRTNQWAQGQLLAATGSRPIAPPAMQAAMCALPLRGCSRAAAPECQRQLRRAGIQVPLIPLNAEDEEVPVLLRVSSFAYNTPADVERLIEALPVEACV